VSQRPHYGMDSHHADPFPPHPFNQPLVVKLDYKYLGVSLSIVNVYGPYSERIPFWEKPGSFGVLGDPLLLLGGGDLNFTLSSTRSGELTLQDP
jgi:hypothetical protein